jgi:hypothetical protein
MMRNLTKATARSAPRVAREFVAPKGEIGGLSARSHRPNTASDGTADFADLAAKEAAFASHHWGADIRAREVKTNESCLFSIAVRGALASLPANRIKRLGELCTSVSSGLSFSM